MSLKTFAIPATGSESRRLLNVRAARLLAGFQVSLIGRFWVSTEVWNEVHMESVGGRSVLRVGPMARPQTDLAPETVDTLAKHSRVLTTWGRQLESTMQAIPDDLKVDLIGRFAAEDPDRCFVDLSHETSEGYRMTAEAILAAMVQKGLVPAPAPSPTR